MTPHQILALYCISLGEWPKIGLDPAETQVLKEDGLIRLDEDDRVVTTEKGEAHIAPHQATASGYESTERQENRQLCLLPQPVEAWVDHNGNLIKLS